MALSEEWFSEWFDSPYYHLLYFQRGDNDAREFIDALIRYIDPDKNAHILDLACGRGRHAIYLNKKGYHVTGLDLSPQNIAIARKSENQNLHFDTHDMRDPLPLQTYDLVLNLFTSFGYFSSDEEHIEALANIAGALKPGGRFVLDYMNAAMVSENLVHHNQTTIKGITFDLRRRITDGFIEKDIRFSIEGKNHFFQERVRSFSQDEIEYLIREGGMKILSRWGDHQLNDFDVRNSERLILYCCKQESNIEL